MAFITTRKDFKNMITDLKFGSDYTFHSHFTKRVTNKVEALKITKKEKFNQK